jgi:hypothetical protein
MAIGMIVNVVVNFPAGRLRRQNDKDDQREKGDLFHNKGFELGRWVEGAWVREQDGRRLYEGTLWDGRFQSGRGKYRENTRSVDQSWGSNF